MHKWVWKNGANAKTIEKKNGDTKRRTKEGMMALNAELEINDGSERQAENAIALDIEMKLLLWTPNRK